MRPEIAAESDFLEILEAHDRIVIYGAGVYGKILLIHLQNVSLSDRIEGFAVSNLGDEDMAIDGFPVRSFECYKDIGRDTIVIVAVSDKYASAIEKSLGEKGDFDFVRFSYKNLPIFRNKIYFYAASGYGYGGNCKYIAEELIRSGRDLQYVWGRKQHISANVPEEIVKATEGTPEDTYHRLTSFIHISNYYAALDCDRKRKGQYYIGTWHGTGPFKKVAVDRAEVVDREKEAEQCRLLYSGFDLFLSNSDDNTYMFRHSMLYKGEITEWGSPRNDVLFHPEGVREKVCGSLEIDSGKKLLLYMPTFRERREESFDRYDLDFEKIKNCLSDRFGGEYILVYRFHYFLTLNENFKKALMKGVNAGLYEDAQELVAAADVLVTDYSSVMWDFSLTGKPVFLYQNDEKEYTDERGFYEPPESWPYPRAHTQEEMIQIILNFDEADYQYKLRDFFRHDRSFDYGDASARTAERIFDVMDNPEKYSL